MAFVSGCVGHVALVEAQAPFHAAKSLAASNSAVVSVPIRDFTAAVRSANSVKATDILLMCALLVLYVYVVTSCTCSYVLSCLLCICAHPNSSPCFRDFTSSCRCHKIILTWRLRILPPSFHEDLPISLAGTQYQSCQSTDCSTIEPNGLVVTPFSSLISTSGRSSTR